MSVELQHSMNLYEKLFKEHPINYAIVQVPEHYDGLHQGVIVETNKVFNETFSCHGLEFPHNLSTFMSNYFQNKALHVKLKSCRALKDANQPFIQFNLFSERLDMHFLVKAFHIDPQHVVTYFMDISEEQRQKMDLSEKTHALSNLVQELDRKNVELEGLNQKLFMDSITDSLTKVYNRQFLIYSMENNAQLYRQRGVPFSLAMFDIDYFKNVNDTYGHMTGDQLLVDLCITVKDAIRDHDIFGRYGGDEFILLLPDTRYDTAYAIAERVRGKIELNNRFSALGMTISGGVFEYKGEEISQMLDEVDSKLYNAKNSGKNIVVG